jgi:putative addiction module component (TIGR02574 family)
MTVGIEKWKSELAGLTPQERAELAHFLIESLVSEADPEVEAAWDVELSRRADEIMSGKAVGKPAEQVFAELRQRFS